MKHSYLTAFILALCVIVCPAFAQDNVKARIEKLTPQVQAELSKAQQEQDYHSRYASSHFQGEKPNDYASELAKTSQSAIKELDGLERQNRPGYQGLSASTRQFKPYIRLTDSVQRVECSSAFSSGPMNTVSPHNGEICFSAIDLSAPTRGEIGFTFIRTYRSHVNYAGSMGFGWDHNHNIHIIGDTSDIASATKLTLYNSNEETCFTKEGNSWKPEKGSFLKLETITSSKHIIISNSEKTVFDFEPVKDGWRIAKITSRKGAGKNALTYKYDSRSGQLQTVTDPFGNQYQFSYSPEGYLKWVQGNSQIVHFDYDRNGCLISTRIPSVAIDLQHSADSVERYKWIQSNDRYLLQEIAQNSGKTAIRYAYDHNRVTQAGLYALSDNIKNEWLFNYSEGKTVIQPPKPFPVKTLVYDTEQAHASLPIRQEISALKATWEYQYNTDNLLIQTTTPDGQIKKKVYDSDNADVTLHSCLLKDSIVGNGSGSGNLIETGTRTRYLENSPFPEEVTYYQIDKSGKETVLGTESFSYSKDGAYLLQESVSFTVPTKYYYNAYGETALIQYADNSCKIFFYGTSYPKEFGNTLNNSEGSVDGSGLCVRVISDANKSEIERAVRSLKLDNLKINSNTVNEITYKIYSSRGELLVQQTNNHINYEYSNRLGETIYQFDSQQGINLTQLSNSFEKTAVYHVLADKNASWAIRLPLFSNAFYKESYKYNSIGQLIEYQPTNEPMGTEKSCPVWKYERTPSGLLLSMTNPDGVCRITSYNDCAQVEKVQLKNNDCSVVLESDYSYTPEGRVLGYRNNHQQLVSIEYDSLGRVYKSVAPDGQETFTEINGLNQTVKKSIVNSNKILSQTESVFGLNNQLVKQTQLLIYNDESKNITTLENIYDISGRIIASRGVQTDSWSLYFYDGLDRQIATVNPVGDMTLVCYANGNPVYQKQIETNILTNTKVAIGSLSLFDSSDRPWLNIPVSANNMLISERKTISHADIAGNIVFVQNGKSTETRYAYDTLGNKLTQTISPISHTFGEKEICSEYTYSLSGLPLTETTFNDALGIFGSNDKLEMDFVNAPQVIRHSYDELGREIETKQPDGLIIRKKYNASSLVEQIQWIGKEDNILRSLKFTHDVLQRPVEIQDVLSGKTVRTMKYDELGNLQTAVDYADGCEITAKRVFDSFSNIRQETLLIDGNELPQKFIDITPEDGIQILKWKGCHASSDKYWYQMELLSDNAGRISQLNLNHRKFAAWKYQGTRVIQRQIPESKLSQNRQYNELNELKGISIVSDTSDDVLLELRYNYGVHGEIISKSTTIQYNKQKKEQTQYYQYDSFLKNVGENNDSYIPNDYQRRYNEIFQDGTDVVSHLTKQMRYDQAGNIWSTYRGENRKVVPGNLPQSQIPQYISPAKLIANSSDMSEFDLNELASNRNTTIAQYEKGKLQAKEYKYHDLGCLTEYDGKFTNESGTEKNVRWFLSYDVFGRLLTMEAKEKQKDEVSNDKTVARLNFAYDAFNRRLIKTVQDFTSKTERSKTFATLYERNHPCIILSTSSISNNWFVEEEYLWGVESQELLMSILPERKVEKLNNSEISRYYAHQDGGYSVIATTSVVGGQTQFIGYASYLAFGENSTSADIVDIKTSGNVSNKSAAYDLHLDEPNNARVSFGSSKQFLEIQLGKHSNLQALIIYSNSFLGMFDVYCIPGEEPSPTAENLDAWIKNAQEFNYANYIGSYQSTESSLENPCQIPLFGIRSNRIVLVWDEKQAPSNLDIREIEINISPENSGSIAFAGQWLDSETGLYYQTNRYRLPELNGKFISPDPLGFTDGINFYAYAHNNPLSWHDPDGQFAHIAIGAGIGAIMGGGMYALSCWLTGEEFSWAKFGVATVAGAASGAVAAATFGAVAPLLTSTWGGAAIAGSVSYGAGGAVHGMINGTGQALIDGNGLQASLLSGAYRAAEEGILGAITGGISSGVTNVLPLSMSGFARSAVSGTIGGTISGGIYGGYAGYKNTGTWEGVRNGMIRGATTGAVIGGSLSIASWGVGQLSGKWRPLPEQPEGIPDPRTQPGTMVKSYAKRADLNVTYGNVEVTPGQARHHIKPLCLGGKDDASNIVKIPENIHRQPHPGTAVKSAPGGTIFY